MRAAERPEAAQAPAGSSPPRDEDVQLDSLEEVGAYGDGLALCLFLDIMLVGGDGLPLEGARVEAQSSDAGVTFGGDSLPEGGTSIAVGGDSADEQEFWILPPSP